MHLIKIIYFYKIRMHKIQQSGPKFGDFLTAATILERPLLAWVRYFNIVFLDK